MFRSSPPEVFSGKGILKTCSQFTGEHPYRIVIYIKLLCNFIEIILRNGCSPVNLLRAPDKILEGPGPNKFWMPWRMTKKTNFQKNISGKVRFQRWWDHGPLNPPPPPLRRGACCCISLPYEHLFLRTPMVDCFWMFYVKIQKSRILTETIGLCLGYK